jgi:large subunit ribosomal protein L17
MRHRKAGRQLGRNASHRLALMRNLTRALIEHERIITTVEKAKEARSFVEKLITLAKKSLDAEDAPARMHARRLAVSKLGPMAKVDLLDKEEETTGDTVVGKLFKDLAPRFKDRPGGYTRVIKRHERRLGDAGHTAFLELLKEGETKKQKKRPAAAPAPKVAKEPEEKAEKPVEKKEKKAEQKPAAEAPAKEKK